MAFVPLEFEKKTNCKGKIKILIFTEGTIIGPTKLRNWFEHKKNVPIKNCVEKIKVWANQGADIYYLTSLKRLEEVNQIRNILVNYGFVGERLYYRGKNEKYKDIAEEVLPNVLIEDNCKSIGGKWQMTITYVRKEIKNKIKSIVVKEFEGIDQLPNDTKDLLEK